MKESWDGRIAVQEIFSVPLSAVGHLFCGTTRIKGASVKVERHNSDAVRGVGGDRRRLGRKKKKEIQARLFPQVNLGRHLDFLEAAFRRR